MTFEQILPALKRGKKVTRKLFSDNPAYATEYVEICDAPYYFKVAYKDGQTIKTNKPPSSDDIFADDWYILDQEDNSDESGVSIEGLICKVTTNFDELEQALDKFRCRLEDLREAAEKLNGIKLDINIDFD